jgi:hypothetical protein
MKGSFVAATFATIDDYIGSFPEDVQDVLEQVRRRIRKVVPAGEETISYQIPTITLDGTYLVSSRAGRTTSASIRYRLMTRPWNGSSRHTNRARAR